eukprot:TRINITY_DN17058_c0_g1_i1.p1 TRINITY_DN17058_c0_g1~~TRINITY_DN17058_c0_g1_i1.p1  ORF type:complete len:266 (+),score=35.95 TRINITY_DN17058_c0_g1_i1:67-798(+)
MCFNQPISLGFAVVAFTSAYIVYRCTNNIRLSFPIAYFGLMEALQFIQYFVIDECSSPINKALTLVAYVHICFQPLVTAILGSGLSITKEEKGGSYMLIRLGVVAGVCMLAKFLLHPWAPDMDILEECPSYDWYRGNDLCTYSGTVHLAWAVPLYPPTYMVPSSNLHFFLFFAPCFVSWKFVPMGLIILATGPLLSMYLTDNLHEQPAIWCLVSVGQLSGAVVLHYFMGNDLVDQKGKALKAE